MSGPIYISDEEDQITPLPSLAKKQRRGRDSIPMVIVSDSDPTPQRPPATTSTPIFVAETPMSDDVSFVKCSFDSRDRVSNDEHKDKFSGMRVISLESDNDSESGSGRENWMENESFHADIQDFKDSERESRLPEATFSIGSASLKQMSQDRLVAPTYLPLDADQVEDDQDIENFGMEQMGNISEKSRNAKHRSSTGEAVGKKKLTKEEKDRAIEEKKLKKEQDKLQKAAFKAEATELKRIEKEKQKWEKGKFALQSIVAEVDTKVVELGSVGGPLLSRFSEKGLSFRITSNPIERSIIWTMTVPESFVELFPQGVEIPYILLVYEADEFCNLISKEIFLDHVSRVRSQYPSYTVCYLTNKLLAYINKREKEQYKTPSSSNGWRRPPIEEVLAKLTTHYARVHSRLCRDEAELAEHVVGLTSSLASCQFRKKSTRLTVNANGSIIPKDSVDRSVIKKSLWLKALVSIPKVQPRFALAISKKYPTMKSLLSVYMDEHKSVHEKENLLKDLAVEGVVSGDRRLGEICSKRVYRILMAQSGRIITDYVEDGADYFTHQHD